VSAIRAASAFVTLSLNQSGFTKGLKSVEKTLASSAAKIRNVGAIATGIGTAGVAAFTLAVKSASDLGEAVSKTSEVFGDSKDVVLDFAETSADAFGISRRAANDYASELGLILLKTGSTRAESAKMSVDLVKLAADIASFNNISIDEALEKLKAGLVGSSEPLRTVGVLLSAAAVETKAAELGFEKVNGQFEEGAKVAARYALIIEQTKETQGDFARTSDSLANVNRRILASFEDISSSIGGAILPLYESLASHVAVVTKWVANFVDKNKVLTQVVFGAAVALTAFGTAAVAVGTAISATLVVVNSLLALLNLLAAPLGLISLAIAGVVAQLTVFTGLPLAAFFTIWITQSEDALTLMKSLGGELGKFLKIATDTFGGLLNAISVGEWSFAGEIAVTGLKAAILTGIESIQDNWKSWLEFLISSFRSSFDFIIDYATQALLFVARKITGVNIALFKIANGDLLGASVALSQTIEFDFTGDPVGFLGGIKEQAAEARNELSELLDKASDLASDPPSSDGAKAQGKEVEGLVSPPAPSGGFGFFTQLIDSGKSAINEISNLLPPGGINELIQGPEINIEDIKSGLATALKAAQNIAQPFFSLFDGKVTKSIEDGQSETRRISSQGTFNGLAAAQLGGGSLTSRMFALQKQQHDFDRKKEQAQKARDKMQLDATKQNKPKKTVRV